MKLITNNLLTFSLCLLVLTIIFRFSLSYMLQHRLFEGSFIVGVVYGVLVFALGWVFGKRDRLQLSLYDIGLRFHLATYVICNLIAAFWLVSGLKSDLESMGDLKDSVVYWGEGLIIHFIMYLATRRKAINGIKRSEIFE